LSYKRKPSHPILARVRTRLKCGVHGSTRVHAQWKEASFTDSRGDVFRVYTVCNVDATLVDNWLRLPFVRVSDADLDHDQDDADPVRLYVELRFTMRRCSAGAGRVPGLAAAAQRCRESLKLLAYDATTASVGNARRPTWDDRTYRTVGVVAADRVFDDAADTSAVNSETRALQVGHSRRSERRRKHAFWFKLLSTVSTESLRVLFISLYYQLSLLPYGE